MEISNEFGGKQITSKQAQQIINELSPELKAVADEYLEKGNSPKIALELAYKASAIIDKQKIEELKKGL